MPLAKRTGHRRIFKLPHHRVTREALDQAIDLLEKAAIVQNTAVFGRGPRNQAMGGVLSNWKFVVSQAGGSTLIRFPAAGWLGYTDGNGVAKVVRYDPRLPGQQSSIIVTSYLGPPSSYYIMWRRQEFDTSVRDEAEWIIPTGPTDTAIATIRREVVQFAIAASPTVPPFNFANDWRILAYVGFGPTAADIKVKFLPFMESASALFPRHFYNRAQTWNGTAGYLTGQTDQVTTPGDGLIYHVRRLIDQVYMLKSKGVSISDDGAVQRAPSGIGPWYFMPTISASQYDLVYADIQNRIADYNALPRINALIVLTPVFNPANGGFVEFKNADVIWGGINITTTASVTTAPGSPSPGYVTHTVELAFSASYRVGLVDMWSVGADGAHPSMSGRGYLQLHCSALPTPGTVASYTVQFITKNGVYTTAARIILALWRIP